MELFIRVIDGQAFEHPIIGDNFRDAFPNIDTENLPEGFARFTRYPQPLIGPYEVYQGVSYERDETGNFCDIHHVRNMTDEEKLEKQNSVKLAWQQVNGFPSWNLDEVTCTMQPPVAYPDDGNVYKWDETTTSWLPVSSS